MPKEAETEPWWCKDKRACFDNKTEPANLTKISQKRIDHEQGPQPLPRDLSGQQEMTSKKFDDREVGERDRFEAESENKRGSVEVPDALAILRLGAENDEWEDGEW